MTDSFELGDTARIGRIVIKIGSALLVERRSGRLRGSGQVRP